jgi:hypothetical protein
MASSTTGKAAAAKKIYYEGWLDKKSPSGTTYLITPLPPLPALHTTARHAAPLHNTILIHITCLLSSFLLSIIMSD